MHSEPIAPSIVAVLVCGIALALATGACNRGGESAQAAAIGQIVEAFDLAPRDWLLPDKQGRWRRGHLEWGKPRIAMAADGRSCTVSVVQISYLYRSNELEESFATRADAEEATKLDPLLETLSARYELQPQGWARVSGDGCHPFAPGSFRHAPAEIDSEAPTPSPGPAGTSGQP